MITFKDLYVEETGQYFYQNMTEVRSAVFISFRHEFRASCTLIEQTNQLDIIPSRKREPIAHLITRYCN